MWLGASAVAGAAALAVIIAVATSTGATVPFRHLDGQGPLGSGGNSTSSSGFDFTPSSGPGPWTLGYSLCLVQGTQPAVIDSVSATRTSGDGYRFLGALMHEFHPQGGNFGILSAPGFPPTVPDRLRSAIGYSVTSLCSHTGPPDPYTELLIGFGRAPGVRGGGWTGIDVGYTVAGQHHIVTLGYYIYICGPGIPDPVARAGCFPPGATAPPQ
jgi:hypothetical protein